MTEQTAPDVTYEVAAGVYPYRIDGLRLSGSEATDYLVARKDYPASKAFAAVHLARVDACNAAETAVYHRGGDRFTVAGHEVTRQEAVDLLVREYRRTRPEAELLLGDAESAFRVQLRDYVNR